MDIDIDAYNKQWQVYVYNFMYFWLFFLIIKYISNITNAVITIIYTINYILFLVAAGGPRFQGNISHSRVAIRQMLGQRHPGGAPMMGPGGQPGPNPAFSTMAPATTPMPTMARQALIRSV